MYYRHYGYQDGFWYTNGRQKNNFVGWAGNESSELNEIIEEAVTLKKSTPLPRAMFKYKTKKEFLFVKGITFTYTKEIFPYGRCLKVNYPEISSQASLIGFFLTGNKTIHKYDFQVYLTGENFGTKNC